MLQLLFADTMNNKVEKAIQVQYPNYVFCGDTFIFIVSNSVLQTLVTELHSYGVYFLESR